MTYVLGAQRDGSPAEMLANFERYRAYLADSRTRFPANAYALAIAGWYYDFNDHRCPHDAWLEQVMIREDAADETGGARAVSVEVRLLGAYHDGHIYFRYPRVFAYRLDAWDSGEGHRDWRYDEFRLSETGHVLHEVEWAGAAGTSRWLIEASDVQMRWEPVPAAG
jgi:hypothetical protein